MSARLDTALAELLRDPSALLGRTDDPRTARPVALACLLAAVVGSAVFGGTVGTLRGGLQVPFAAVKLPLVTLITLITLTPVVHTLCAVLGRPTRFASTATVVLLVAGRASLALLAFAPMLGLAIVVLGGYRNYHQLALLAAALYGVAAWVGARVLRGYVADVHAPRLVLALSTAVYFVVTAHGAWTLRPWLLRPRSEVTFVRPAEGVVTERLGTAARSSMGRYDTPAPGGATR